MQIRPRGEQRPVDPELGRTLGEPGPRQGGDRTQPALDLIARGLPEGAVAELEAGANGIEQPGLGRDLGPATVEPPHPGQLVHRGGRSLGDGHDGQIREHEAGGPIRRGGAALAPRAHRLGDGT